MDDRIAVRMRQFCWTLFADAAAAMGVRARHTELAAGVRTTASFTVEHCLKDWLETLNTQAENTVTGYRIMARHLIGLIGNVKLVDLKVRDVQFALGKLAERLSTRSVRLARMILIQAIRNAVVNDLVVRNVAELAAVPTGKPRRSSRSLNLEQALAVLDAAKGDKSRHVFQIPAIAVEAMRHTFVSLPSDSGVPIEQIADAVGHASTRTTEVVYRHQLRPVTRTAVIALGPLSESKGKTTGGQS